MFMHLENKKILILITTGGTGGHVVSGLAVADVLSEQGVKLLWVGSETGLEKQLVPAAGIDLETLPVQGFRGKNRMATLVIFPFLLIRAVLRAMVLLRKYRPTVVLGMGGFAAAPASIAAWILKIPLIVHEQNAVVGIANRLLMHLSRRVLLGFPHTRLSNAKKHAQALPLGEYVGNPVRSGILSLPGLEQRMENRNNKRIHMLVVGGSQGCSTFNQIVPLALLEIPAAMRPVVKHQTGRHKLAATSELFEANQLEAELFEFSNNMSDLYAWADIVLCRAGALSVAEIANVGVGAIFVPYPFSVDDHQTANAGLLEAAGAAYLIREMDFTVKVLADLLKRFASARQELLEMGKKARQFACPDAAQRIAQICLEESRA